MKRSIISSLLLVSLIALFAACETPVLPIGEVTGEYKGQMTYDLKLVDPTPVPLGVKTAIVASPDNNKLVITFQKVNVPNYDLGTFDVECGADYDDATGSFILSGDPYVDLNGQGKSIARVSGKASPGVIDITLDLKSIGIVLNYLGYKSK